MAPAYQVLLVEDNPGDARLIEIYLHGEYQSSFDCRPVSTLAAALAALREAHWDVVLLDLGLPDSQGFATFERLQNAARALPIVVLSGHDDESLALKAVQAGAQDYLVKGRIDAYALGRALHYAIERNKAEGQIHFQAELLDSVGEAVIATTLEGSVVYWNRFAETLYGWSRDEVIGKPILEITPSEMSREQAAEILAQLERGECWAGDFVVRRKDGSSFTARVTDTPILGKAGELLGVVGVSSDVSWERQLNERALQDYHVLLGKLGRLAQEVSLARALITVYRAVFAFLNELMPCNGGFVALYDAERDMRYCEYAWAEGVEEDASALPPLPMNESSQSCAIRTGEAVVVSDYPAALETGPHVDLGVEIDPDLPRSVLVVPMSVLGRVIGAIEVQSTSPGAYNDYHVTALRMAANLVAIAIENVQYLERETALREEAQRSEKRYRELLEQASDGIFIFDSEAKLIEVNTQACKLTGYTRDELLSMNVSDLIDPDDLAKRPLFFKEIREYSPFIFERLFKRKDGTRILTEVSSALTSSGYFQSIVRDISERKRQRQALEDSRRILQSSLDAQAAHIAILNEAGTIVAVNEAWRKFSRDNGYQGDDSGVGQNYLQVCDLVTGEEEGDAQEAARGIRQVIEGQRESLRLEYPCHSPEEQRWFELKATRFSGDGRVPVVIVHENVTMRKLAELLELDRRKVLELVSRNASLKDVFGQLVMMIHHQLPHAACLLMERSDDRLFPAAAVGFPEAFRRDLEQGVLIGETSGPCGLAAHTRAPVVVPDIEVHPVCETCQAMFLQHGIRAVWSEPVLSGAGAVLGTFGLFYSQPTPADHDALQVLKLAGQLAAVAIEHQQLLERLSYQATHDSLTGLANRLLLEDHLQLALAQARRNDEKVAVLFMDLDDFKKVNDSLGHQVGDRLLKLAAERLLGSTREHDTVARVGGDEFAVILPAIGSPEAAVRTARKLMRVFDEPFDLLGHDAYVDVSIGISYYPDDADDVIGLLRNADTAMYRAKLAGKNSVTLFSADMNSAALERLELEAQLRRALARGEFELHYQPQIDLQSGSLIGAEALVRWRQPERGLVPPGRFIPVAEASGLIIPLGQWVLAEACRQRMAWRDAGMDDFFVAVNVSAKQFNRPEFVENVKRTVRASGLEPGLLELEVTESVVMRDITQVADDLGALKDFGVRIAIDDFGTGYSSLAYLKRLPVDVLKIDRSFVMELDHQHQGVNTFTLSEALVTLAHGLGLGVVAEGVETEGQLQALRKMGCDTAQGYYYARPLPAEAFAELYWQHKGSQQRYSAS